MRISDWSSDVCSSDLRSITAHDAIQRQNSFSAWPFKRQFCVDPPSCAKNVASMSVYFITPRNSAWLPNSMKSFGAGVAVEASRKGMDWRDWIRLEIGGASCRDSVCQ